MLARENPGRDTAGSSNIYWAASSSRVIRLEPWPEESLLSCLLLVGLLNGLWLSVLVICENWGNFTTLLGIILSEKVYSERARAEISHRLQKHEANDRSDIADD